VDADLAAYVALAALVALAARWWAAMASGVVLWMFYDGFLVGRHAVLTWHGSIDAWRLAFILAGAASGLLQGRVSRQAARPNLRPVRPGDRMPSERDQTR
jgi:hypothetical protein